MGANPKMKSRRAQITELCTKLDHLVESAEKMGRETKSRAATLKRADRVREELRELDH